MNKKLVVLLLSLPLLAQPSAEEVVAKTVAALGGAEKLAAVASMRMKGIYVYNGIEHPMVISRAGNRVRFDIQSLSRYATSLEDGKDVVRCFDGQQAWGMGEREDAEGAYTMAPERARVIAHRAELHGALVSHALAGHRATLVGAADVDGTETWQLTVTLADDEKQSWFVDQKTHLPVKLSIEHDDRFEPASWFFDDWREVGGIQIPHFVHCEEWLFAREHLIESVEINPDLDDALFKKPAG